MNTTTTQTVLPCSGGIDARAGNRAEYDRADVASHGAAAALLTVQARRSMVVDNLVVAAPDMDAIREEAAYLARYFSANMPNVRVAIRPIAAGEGRFTPADLKAARPSAVITADDAATTAPTTPSSATTDDLYEAQNRYDRAEAQFRVAHNAARMYRYEPTWESARVAELVAAEEAARNDRNAARTQVADLLCMLAA